MSRRPTDPRVAQRGCSLAWIGSSTTVVHPTRESGGGSWLSCWKL